VADPLALLADRFDPPERDVFGLLGYAPTPRQRVFHEATEFDVLYGGAAGGGKTKALLMHALAACDRYPGLVAACFRRTYPELDESLIHELSLVGFAQALGCRWNASKRDLRFPNGSLIRFRYAETVEDATRRQGSEIQLLIVDERTQVVPGVVEYLSTRLRSGRAEVPVLGLRSGTNPGGIGHANVKAKFVDATEYGQHVVTDERGRLRRFVPARVDDNPHINAEYVADLEGIADLALRAALRDGNWDSFVGQVFSEWRRDRHVVRPMALPPEWWRYAGIDHGYAAPWATLWAAQDNDGRVWVYREAYESGVGEKEQARRILAAEGALTTTGLLRRDRPDEQVRARLADPSMWAKKGDATPIAQAYGAEGCHLVAANNDRINGWARVHSYLAEAPACDHHRALGWETCPLLHVFETCSNLIRTLPSLPYDTHKVEDVDTDAEDHAPDALRYLLMFLPLPRTGREAAAVPTTDSERFSAYIAKQAKAKARSRRRPL
jgi:hypothetical protein